jgi:hypothetical protein
MPWRMKTQLSMYLSCPYKSFVSLNSPRWSFEVELLHLLNILFFFSVLGLELRTYTLSHPTSRFL